MQVNRAIFPTAGPGECNSQIKSPIFLFGLCCLVRGLLQIINYSVLLLVADFEFCLGNKSVPFIVSKELFRGLRNLDRHANLCEFDWIELGPGNTGCMIFLFLS